MKNGSFVIIDLDASELLVVSNGDDLERPLHSPFQRIFILVHASPLGLGAHTELNILALNAHFLLSPHVMKRVRVLFSVRRCCCC
jgi:hypothetical protein